MYKYKEVLIYSPSDLTTFMSSPFASWMNRLKVESPEKAPEQDESDSFGELLSNKGLEHEKTLLK